MLIWLNSNKLSINVLNTHYMCCSLQRNLKIFQTCLKNLIIHIIINKFKIELPIYADDCQLYVKLQSMYHNAVRSRPTLTPRDCVHDIASWMEANRFKLNDTKTEIIVFYPPMDSFSIENAAIEASGP